MRFPPMKRLPRGATIQDRADAYLNYIDQMVLMFGDRYLPLGTEKRWWHFGKLEHPLTKYKCGCAMHMIRSEIIKSMQEKDNAWSSYLDTFDNPVKVGDEEQSNASVQVTPEPKAEGIRNA